MTHDLCASCVPSSYHSLSLSLPCSSLSHANEPDRTLDPRGMRRDSRRPGDREHAHSTVISIHLGVSMHRVPLVDVYCVWYPVCHPFSLSLAMWSSTCFVILLFAHITHNIVHIVCAALCFVRNHYVYARDFVMRVLCSHCKLLPCVCVCARRAPVRCAPAAQIIIRHLLCDRRAFGATLLYYVKLVRHWIIEHCMRIF